MGSDGSPNRGAANLGQERRLDLDNTGAQIQNTLWEDESSSPLEKEKEDEETDDGYELVEVGRGLANYNSAQIKRVKGLKRCVSMVIYSSPLQALIVNIAPIYPTFLVTQIRNTLSRTLLSEYHHRHLAGERSREMTLQFNATGSITHLSLVYKSTYSRCRSITNNQQEKCK